MCVCVYIYIYYDCALCGLGSLPNVRVWSLKGDPVSQGGGGDFAPSSRPKPFHRRVGEGGSPNGVPY